ncbi:MAG: L-threonylcarbamoyladenylate synthase [Patescibacteria group bacterium]
MKKVDWKEVGELLQSGKIGIIPTDTIYGISAQAFREDLIEKIYTLKKRDRRKPFIFLISQISDLEKFGIKIGGSKKRVLEDFWPGKVSIVFSCSAPNLKYLHRGVGSLAFRLPKNQNLLALLKKTGPLVSTSVNQEGRNPAENFQEIEEYFGNELDFCLDAGDLKGHPSTVLDFSSKKVRVLRRGEWKKKEHFSAVFWRNLLDRLRG